MILAVLTIVPFIQLISPTPPPQPTQQATVQFETPKQEVKKPKSSKPKVVRYRVKSGDTLVKIGKKTKTPWKRIWADNRQLKNQDLLSIGDVLRIPRKSDKLRPRKLVALIVVHQTNRVVRRAAAPVRRPVVATGSVQQIIVHWANHFGANPTQMLRVAACESGFNLYAYNKSGATGLFQFMPSTFNGYRVLAGAGGNIYSANDQARTAAYMFAHGQARQWVCK